MLEKSELIKQVKQKFFLPLVNELEKNNPGQLGFFFERAFSYLQDIKTTHNLNYRNNHLMNLSIQKLQHKNTFNFGSNHLNKTYVSLASLYLEGKVDDIQYPLALIDSIIRELVFDYLQPLSILNLANFSTYDFKDRLSENLIVGDFPGELTDTIYNFLSLKTKFSLARTCRSNYMFHKKSQSNSMLYLIGDEIKITRSKWFMNGSAEFCLDRNISSEIIFKSLCNPSTQRFEVFTSLFQALEFAQSQQHGGRPGDNENDGYMPPVWMVLYDGDIKTLSFEEKILTINKNSHCSVYQACERNAVVYSSTIDTKTFLPLQGISLWNGNFGKYQILGHCDIKDKAKPEETCIIS